MKGGRLAGLIAAALIGAGAALGGVGLASATSPARATLAPYHFDSPDMKIYSTDAKDVVITQFTIAPGGSTGWHVHPGPTFIVVTAGILTRYEGNDPTCTGHVYGPNTGFVEAPGDVHIARNEGSETVIGMVAYLSVPIGGAVKTLVASPGNCPF
jgi:quercetin dioxygenase-like cupin family protein